MSYKPRRASRTGTHIFLTAFCALALAVSAAAAQSWRPLPPFGGPVSALGDGLPADAPVVDLLASAGDPHRLYAVAAGHGLFVQDPAAP